MLNKSYGNNFINILNINEKKLIENIFEKINDQINDNTTIINQHHQPNVSNHQTLTMNNYHNNSGAKDNYKRNIGFKKEEIIRLNLEKLYFKNYATLQIKSSQNEAIREKITSKSIYK